MVSPINYIVDVRNPIDEMMRGYSMGRSDIAQRQQMQEREQMMGLRQSQEIRAQAAFEEQQRARADVQAQVAKKRAEAEAGQAALARLVDLGSAAGSDDFIQAWVANPAIRDDLASYRAMLTDPQIEARFKTHRNVYAAAFQGNVGVVRNLFDEQMRAAENSGDQSMIPSLRSALEQLEKDPEKALSQMLATASMVIIDTKGPEYLKSMNEALGLGQGGGEDLPADYQNLQLRAREAGLEPGTPEYQNFMLTAGAVDTSEQYRPATPEEAAQYGSKFGQINKATGRFLKNDPPSGMSVRTTPDGGFEVVQGPGVQTSFKEQESKDIVFATRAEGALEDLEPFANELANLAPRLFEYVPLSQGRQFQSPEFQRANIAGLEFLAAVLRKDTGAAVTDTEIEIYGAIYLPQPGDSPAALDQKAKARRRAIEALKAPMSETAQAAVKGALQGGEGVDLDFSTMSKADILKVDVMSLTLQQLEDIYERNEELR